jgi:hypothetical protein
MSNGSDRIHESLIRLEHWAAESHWKGYDTFDGLSSPLAKIFTFNHPFLKQVWQQGVRRFPINLRPVLGIKTSPSSKGMGFFAQGYLKLHDTYGAADYLDKAKACFQWLKENRCPGFKGSCWGNHFDYQHRSGSIAKGVPTLVWTGLIGHAFLDGYEALGDQSYLQVAQSACEFIVDEMGYVEYGDAIYLNYYPGATHRIHNSNMIGAGLLARVQHHSANSRFLEAARRAVRWTMRQQSPDGSWPYGAGDSHTWVDSFHTGYVLEALDIYNRNVPDAEYAANLEKGYRYYIETFFEDDGTPRYYSNKTRPLDIQCASQGIQTLIGLSRLHPRSAEVAMKVALWTINNMQDRSGYFYYRKYPFCTNKTPTLHWGQATMFAALSTLDQFLQPAKRVTHPAVRLAAQAA